jgi:hypothetical protein
MVVVVGAGVGVGKKPIKLVIFEWNLTKVSSNAEI